MAVAVGIVALRMKEWGKEGRGPLGSRKKEEAQKAAAEAERQGARGLGGSRGVL